MQRQTSSQEIKFLYGDLVSISLPSPKVDVEAFLASNDETTRFYWRHDEITFAGLGIAVALTSIGEQQVADIREQIAALFDNAQIHTDNPLAAPRLFGGFSFFKDFVSDFIWSSYYPAHFVLPHYQLLRIGNEQWMTINAQAAREEINESLVQDLREALQIKIDSLAGQKAQQNSPPSMQAQDYPMPFEQWAGNIGRVVDGVRAGELEKVVLARVCEMRFNTQIEPLAALRYLSSEYPETYRFLFEPRPQHAFLGATPELLIGVQGGRVETMGLAGSIARGTTPEETAALGQELLNSTKDRHEHQLVVDAMAVNLAEKVDDLHIGEMGVMTLSNIQHLHTPIWGKRKADYDILSLVQGLHPTPALGGKPRDKALKLIAEMEPVPRGWYAAPIGWIDGEGNGQFGVAIRSAVIQDKRVWLYAGAGIVEGSEPQKEWDETALKFRPMLQAFTAGGAS